ncbi:MAG: hypothetical protein ISN29_08805 [Gammaproteobacteria bacterium AqS3]|nr:hypothetical protein [Gammaproteobacteria bacterium AqS3]
MKTQEQSQQEQEIERLLVKLRKQAGNESMAEVYFWLIISGLAVIVSIEALVNGKATSLNILAIPCFLIFVLNWLFRITGNSEKETTQMSAGELALEFEERKKSTGRSFAFVGIGILCGGISILIGAFELSEFFITLSGLGCLFLVSEAYDYWKYQKNEKMARQLAEQSDD